MSKNVYEMVTDRIIAELEKGLIPWEKPWSGASGGAFNRISKKPYSLLNQILIRKRRRVAHIQTGKRSWRTRQKR